MAFCDWKKRSQKYVDLVAMCLYAKGDIERTCAAAYKAGEREGMKVAEEIAARAILLRQKLGE